MYHDTVCIDPAQVVLNKSSAAQLAQFTTWPCSEDTSIPVAAGS